MRPAIIETTREKNDKNNYSQTQYLFFKKNNNKVKKASDKQINCYFIRCRWALHRWILHQVDGPCL